MTFKAAAHGHDPVHGKDRFRTVRKQAGQIGHGPQGDHGAGLSPLSRCKSFFQKLLGGHRVLIAWNFWKKAFSQPIGPMSVQGVHIFPFQRPVCPHINRDIQASHVLKDLFCIGKSHVHRAVPTYDGDGLHLDLFHRQRQHQSQAVVDPRITVNDHLLYHFVHPVFSFRFHAGEIKKPPLPVSENLR